jgi:hypothetical protein
MEVNLRKAKALQDTIRTEISKARSEVTGSDTVNIYEEDITSCVDDVIRKVETAYDRGIQLRRALFDIRRKTKAANATSGIEDLLVEIAELEMEVLMSKDAIDRGELASDKLFLKQAEVMRENTTTSRVGYGSSNCITVSGATENLLADASAAKAKAERRIRDAKDELLGKNVTTKIVLGKETVDTLSMMGII